jgi:hypothetical protein
MARQMVLERSTGRVALSPTSLTLARGAARRIARRLRLARVPEGRLGRLTLTVPGRSASGDTGGSGGSAPGAGGGAAPSTPAELPRLARPATAVAVTSATSTWHVRDSFIQYMNTGEGTSVHNGATAEPPRTGCGNSAQLVYDFHFPFAEGWYDPPSGAAALSFTGGVRFRFSGHGIDITTSDPEIELNGSSSRAIFRFKDADGDRRGVLMNLTPLETPLGRQCSADPGPTGTANPAVSAMTRTYERVAGTIPEGTGDSVFAGFYLPGDQFGWASVSFTTP